jgi:hypothetical protein
VAWDPPASLCALRARPTSLRPAILRVWSHSSTAREPQCAPTALLLLLLPARGRVAVRPPKQPQQARHDLPQPGPASPRATALVLLVFPLSALGAITFGRK